MRDKGRKCRWRECEEYPKGGRGQDVNKNVDRVETLFGLEISPWEIDSVSSFYIRVRVLGIWTLISGHEIFEDLTNDLRPI